MSFPLISCTEGSQGKTRVSTETYYWVLLPWFVSTSRKTFNIIINIIKCHSLSALLQPVLLSNYSFIFAFSWRKQKAYPSGYETKKFLVPVIIIFFVKSFLYDPLKVLRERTDRFSKAIRVFQTRATVLEKINSTRATLKRKRTC